MDTSLPLWWAYLVIAALLGGWRNSGSGARWFTLSAAFYAVAWPLLISVMLSYKLQDPPVWVTTLFFACIAAHGALAGVSLQRAAPPRRWNVWLAEGLLMLPLLWLLGSMGLGFYLTR